VENGASDLPPVRTNGFGIEKSEVCHEVLLVVCRQDIRDGASLAASRSSGGWRMIGPPFVGRPAFAFENGATVAP